MENIKVKEFDFDKDIKSTIKNIENFYVINIAGNIYDQNITSQQIDDIRIYLSDKEFLEKYYPSKLKNFDDDDFNEYGDLENGYIHWGETYVVTFIDDSELYIDFWEDDVQGNFNEIKQTDQGQKYIDNFEKSNWDTDKLNHFIENKNNKNLRESKQILEENGYKFDFEKDILPTIRNIESYYFVNVNGTGYDTDIDENQIDDIRIYLSDKEFLDKHYPQLLPNFDDDDFNEYGDLENGYIHWGETYVVTFIDGSMLYIDYFEDDDNPNFAEDPKDNIGKTYIENFENSEWNTTKFFNFEYKFQ